MAVYTFTCYICGRLIERDEKSSYQLVDGIYMYAHDDCRKEAVTAKAINNNTWDDIEDYLQALWK